MKPTELQQSYKKVLSFTETQRQSLKKLAREWKGIKERKDNKCPF